MRTLEKQYRTLAIIGNGFDLAHGYKTSYKSFSESTNAESLKKFKSYCDDESKIETWYNFEENINHLSRALFEKSITAGADKNKFQYIYELKEIFTNIHDLLITYLKSEIQNNHSSKFPTVQKYLNSNTQIINFNYTNIAEKYSNNIFYVHGSIEENDILLGYDYREEACLAQFDDMRWAKDFCREGLAYRRYLKNELKISLKSPEFKRLIESFEFYQQCANSSRGIDENPASYIPDYLFIKEFMNCQKQRTEIPNINYDEIQTIVVLGHGIEADKVFLDTVLKKCSNIKKVVIFRYNGEEDESFNKKVAFFKKYTRNIKENLYE